MDTPEDTQVADQTTPAEVPGHRTEDRSTPAITSATAANPDGTAAMPLVPAPRPTISASRGLQIAQGLLASLATEIDGIDSHFMAAPPFNRALETAEVEMILRRRRTISMIQTLRDDAQAMLDAAGIGPSPF